MRSLSFLQVVFFTYLILGLLIFTFFVPPFQKPDEPAHFHRAVALTNLDFFCIKDANGDYYFLMERRYAELPDLMRTFDVAFRYDNKFTVDWLRDTDFSDPKYNEKWAVFRFCSLPIPGYLPSSLGILAGKPFENPLVSFYLARLAGAIFFFAVIVVSLRVAPLRYQPIIYFYAALPTVLHQVSAVSYDAVQLPLFALIFAFVTRFSTQTEPVKLWRTLVFMGLIWWMINIRLFAYAPILLVYFLVDWSKINATYWRYIAISVAFVAFTAITTGFFHLTYLPRAEDSIPGATNIDATEQAKFVLNHPFSFLEASYNTMRVRGEGLFREMTAVFGWIDYTLNFVPYYLSVLLFGIVFYVTAAQDSRQLRPSQLLILFATIAGTFGALFFSLYAVWTPVGHNIVDGLQGRYFLGLVPFIAFFASQTAAAIGKQNALKLVALGLATLLIFNTFRAIDLRYYEGAGSNRVSDAVEGALPR